MSQQNTYRMGDAVYELVTVAPAARPDPSREALFGKKRRVRQARYAAGADAERVRHFAKLGWPVPAIAAQTGLSVLFVCEALDLDPEPRWLAAPVGPAAGDAVDAEAAE